MNKTVLIFILSFISFSCTVYQKTPVSVEDAVDKGKVKVVSQNGNEVKFDSIARSDNDYVGINKTGSIPFTKQQAAELYLLKKSEPALCKNIIYLTGATVNWSLNVERMILDRSKYHFLIKISGGTYSTYSLYGSGKSSSGNQFSLQAIGLTGKSAKHFEYGFGISYRSDPLNYDRMNDNYKQGYIPDAPEKQDYIYIRPAITIGYRKQNLNGNGIFRAGIGYPEAFYISMGIAF